MSSEVRAFVCDFCPRKARWSTRSIANRHEAKCFYNPARRACVTCAYFSMEDTSIDSDHDSKSPCCGLDLLPVPATADRPERALNFDCEHWEARA